MSASHSASHIASLRLRQILDSRGRPTVEADVILNDGSLGRAAVPSGASTGKYEAHERRDGDRDYYEGAGVRQAIATAHRELPARFAGLSALDQTRVDATLREVDGTATLERIGANAILAVSLANARAAAQHSRKPLYAHLNELSGSASMSLPMPMTNILSGGAHASRGMDFQDFLAIPIGAAHYSEALEWIARVRSCASRLMAAQGLPTLLADEGGLSPGFASAEQALQLMVQSIEAARLRPGEDVAITLDVAASQLYDTDTQRYRLQRLDRELQSAEMAAYVADLCRAYPIVSVEDPLDQDDWEHWRTFTQAVAAQRMQVVGDDLFATHAQRLQHGVERNVANAVLIKLNQNGTLSGTLEVMALARQHGYATVVSARSGETEDAFIADFAVGTGADQIKIGSVRNSERQAKYNQLSRIEEDRTLAFARPLRPWSRAA